MAWLTNKQKQRSAQRMPCTTAGVLGDRLATGSYAPGCVSAALEAVPPAGRSMKAPETTQTHGR
jgi:hypothetical protein